VERSEATGAFYEENRGRPILFKGSTVYGQEGRRGPGGIAYLQGGALLPGSFWLYERRELSTTTGKEILYYHKKRTENARATKGEKGVDEKAFFQSYRTLREGGKLGRTFLRTEGGS